MTPDPDVKIVATFRGRFVYFVDCSACGRSMAATLDYGHAEVAKVEHLIDHDLERISAKSQERQP